MQGHHAAHAPRHNSVVGRVVGDRGALSAPPGVEMLTGIRAGCQVVVVLDRIYRNVVTNSPWRCSYCRKCVTHADGILDQPDPPAAVTRIDHARSPNFLSSVA